MKTFFGTIAVFIFFGIYLIGIFLGISHNKINKDIENIKPEYIFYYDEDYVKCKFLSEEEIYCLFKDIQEI